MRNRKKGYELPRSVIRDACDVFSLPSFQCTMSSDEDGLEDDESAAVESSSQAIGVFGQKRSGKDSLSDLFCSQFPDCDRRNWADGLKECICTLFGVTRAFIEEWKENPEPPPGWLLPMRQVLQKFGDGMRQFKPGVWLDYSFRNPQPKMIFVDGRYINEMSKVKSVPQSVNVLLYRPGFLNDSDHPSEAQVRPIVQFLLECGAEGEVEPVLAELQGTAIPEGTQYIDLFIRNDGTIEDLRGKLNNIILPYIQKVFGG